MIEHSKTAVRTRAADHNVRCMEGEPRQWQLVCFASCFNPEALPVERQQKETHSHDGSDLQDPADPAPCWGKCFLS